MKILFLSPDSEYVGKTKKLCIIGVSFDSVVIGITIDFDWD